MPSTFACEVVSVGALEPHPNADTLSIVQIFGFPVIVKTADWQGREMGCYIPVDAIVPDTPEFAFLDGHRRIKAKKLRGVFSMGLLIPAREGWQVGQDVTAEIGAVKYDSDTFPDGATHTEEAAPPPGLAPCYTDIESLRRHRHVLVEGEEVVVTEKIHGANARYTIRDGALHVGSHKRWKKLDERCIWWRAAAACCLDERLQAIPEMLIFGEVYGQVQDLRYGAGQGEVRFRAFDIFDPTTGRYADFDGFQTGCALTGIDMVPVLYRGPFDFDKIAAIAEEDSVVDGCGGIREGIVVRPVRERVEHMGRVILKLHSQRYLLRKGA